MDIGGFFWNGDEVIADDTRVEINLNNETQVKGTAIHPETGAVVNVIAIINRENNFASFILPEEDGEESY